MANLDQLLQKLNSGSFNEREFLAEIASSSELVESKTAICRVLSGAIDLLELRKLHDMNSSAIMIDSARKDLLESNVTYRNLVKIADNVKTYAAFDRYCTTNKIKNIEVRFTDKVALAKAQNKK
ncbi:hypothetical protein [Pseudomonas syringae]|uniref:hypothetical protein n=1 Tax=Pseudomonas syringae TaxID=317 RepID=UPI00111C8A3A|nr:hypothetical protein [Pseudomonas syringae]